MLFLSMLCFNVRKSGITDAILLFFLLFMIIGYRIKRWILFCSLFWLWSINSVSPME